MSDTLIKSLRLARDIRNKTGIRKEAAIIAASIQYGVSTTELEEEWGRVEAEQVYLDKLTPWAKNRAENYLKGIQDVWEAVQRGKGVKAACASPSAVEVFGSPRTAERIWRAIQDRPKQEWGIAISNYFTARSDRKDHQWRFGPIATAAMWRAVQCDAPKPAKLYAAAKGAEDKAGEFLTPSSRWFYRNWREVLDELEARFSGAKFAP